MNNGVNELRRKYLEFFESKDHLCMKSFSLVPQNDNSLLLINAGMAPLKPYFTGQEIPPKRRVTTCQKCIRTGDIDNVGKTARHLTFFEMLGNFSFGDYFKTEAIHWSWEFLTEVLGLDKDRLYPSIYGEDDEAFRIWNEEIGIPADRITRFYRDPETGACDNFWEHGAGPCGPCSEIYYDRGEKYGCGKPDCKVGCECDRFMEVWNNVFTQYESDGKGHYEELSQKNIDTGMGLERLAVVMQDVDSVFDIDTMKAIRDKVCAISHKTYHTDQLDDVSIRLITDHIRSATFMISDGIMPSNEGRGYVLRRIIRRASRHGRILGIDNDFLAELARTVIAESRDGYPELNEKRAFILNVLSEEEQKFGKTVIGQGIQILHDMEAKMIKNGEKVLSGDQAFKLFDTYGFPIDLTAEILAERGFTYDEEGFRRCMTEQKERARAARKTTNYMGADATVYEQIDPKITTEFDGYEHLSLDSKITALTTESEVVTTLSEGQKGTIIVDRTPFYATMGGQRGDRGVIRCGDAEFVVEVTEKLVGGKFGHIGHMEKGSMSVGDTVSLNVDERIRLNTCRNHSATHLLQKALREVLGSHVEQAGSFQDDTRTRFDFSHFKPMTHEEIRKVEIAVNSKIRDQLPVETAVMSVDEAKKSGAMALFGEKYGEKVRVVSIGDYSKELCGGTHVSNTKEIIAFKIISESGIAAGVRRIEALTAEGVLRHYMEMESIFNEAAKAAKAKPSELVAKIQGMMSEIKALNSEVESLKSKAAKDAVGDVLDSVQEIGGVKLIATKLSGADMNALRDLSDDLSVKLGEGVIVLISDADGKVNLVCKATEEAIAKGAHAGNLIKSIAGKVGGGGGGRPNMAQAGGKNPAGIDDALAEASAALAAQLGA